MAPTRDDLTEFSRLVMLHTDDDSVVLLVRWPTANLRIGKPTGRHARMLGDEPIRIYVVMILRPWVIHTNTIRTHPRILEPLGLPTCLTLTVFIVGFAWHRC